MNLNIEINVEQLQGLTINHDDETAVIQAGAYGAQVIQALWDEGYVTSTYSITVRVFHR